MIIKITLVGLIVVLVAVIAISYYTNKEGFEDIFDTSKKDLSNATNTVAPVEPNIIKDVTNPMAATPQRFDIKPEIVISPTGHDAMTLQQKSDLLKDIQKVVRNELLANRLTTPLVDRKVRDRDTTSTEQGREYNYYKEKDNCYNDECRKDDYRKDNDDNCSKKSDDEHCPDMSKYIKKDAIPCWGCKLDY